MNFSVAFIFDMDGVIVDSNPFHKVALQQFCKQHGHDLTEQHLREKIYGRTNKDWLRNLFGDIPIEQVRQYAEEKELLFRQLYEDDIKPVSGLVPFLEKMDKLEIARAIATSAPKSNVEFTLRKTMTRHFFPVILDDSFVSRGKPDPEIYLKASAALQLSPERCIVIEDSLSGILAGKSAGCKVIGITTTHTPRELSEVDMIIHDFNDLDPAAIVSGFFSRFKEP